MCDDRAVSVAVGYVLNFAIAALLLSALLVSGGGLIDSQTRQVTHDELTVTGQQLANYLTSADRLTRAGNLTELTVRSDLQTQSAAGSYTIQIEYDNATGTGAIELRSVNPEVVVRVPFRSETEIRNTTVSGGPVVIEYDDGGDELAVFES